MEEMFFVRMFINSKAFEISFVPFLTQQLSLFLHSHDEGRIILTGVVNQVGINIRTDI
jgi:hypothetical protein